MIGLTHVIILTSFLIILYSVGIKDFNPLKMSASISEVSNLLSSGMLFGGSTTRASAEVLLARSLKNITQSEGICSSANNFIAGSNQGASISHDDSNSFEI